MRELQVITGAEQMSRVVAAWKSAGETVALVPTMGFLHEGHRALMNRGAETASRVVVSVFVNPLQFAAGEDFERYPRDSARDLAFVQGAPVDVLFVPEASEVYPTGISHTPGLRAGSLGDLFEGEARPGHFDGVLTVVRRLFDIVRPDTAVFGRKDAQQAFLVDSMVAREGLALRVDTIDTVRDSDGLALSSRNSYLSVEQRRTAAAIPRALAQATQQTTVAAAREVVAAGLAQDSSIVIHYVEAVDPGTFLSIRQPPPSGDVVLILAVSIGGTRLIDNRTLHFPQ